MKYSYKWLQELSGTKKSPKEVAQLLTFHAFEIEGVEENENKLEGVVVGEILEIQKHPNADKLRLTKVDIGKKTLDIVCGASNIKVGQKVPVALVGVKLPGSLEIKEAEIRGEKSFGMICAEDELGLGGNHDGIMVLPEDVRVGVPISDILDLNDAMIEIDVLSNRAHDALSHVGMAREISAVEKRKIDYDYDGLELSKNKSEKLKIDIESKDICLRYIGAVIENVKVSDSPQWLKNRLKLCGIKSINNIVDVTNYIMLELGQPLHAFDFEKVRNGNVARIIVRNAKKGEKIKLLDESEKELSENDIVIADNKNSIALAGIMGGLDSGVSKETTTIVLEAANFNASLIRKTRLRAGISTDASGRFEKQIDPNLAEKAMVRAIEMILHIAGGELEGMVDMYQEEIKPWKIKLDLEYSNRLLGENISQKIVVGILESLGLHVSSSKQKNIIEVLVPTFRIDLQNQEDLIEEIGRIYGYEKIKSQSPLATVQTPRIDEGKIFERRIKNELVSQGFDEMYNYSFYAQRDASLAELGSIKHVELANALNSEQNLMRVSLFPLLLKNARENLKNFKEFRIFELGRVYHLNSGVLPEEKNMLCGVLVFEKAGRKEKNQKGEEFFEAKGEINALLQSLGIDDYYFDNYKPIPGDTFTDFWHLGRSAQIKLEGSGKSIGFFGEINPFVLVNCDIHTKVIAFEFELENLREVVENEIEFQPLGKYPEVVRDISMVSVESLRVDDILKVIQASGGELVLDVDLFDIFDFADGSTSFAFHIIFGSNERTLKSDEVDSVMQNISHALEKEFKIQIRK